MGALDVLSTKLSYVVLDSGKLSVSYSVSGIHASTESQIGIPLE